MKSFVSLSVLKKDLVIFVSTWVMASVINNKNYNNICVVTKNDEMRKAIKSKILNLFAWADFDVKTSYDSIKIGEESSIKITTTDRSDFLGEALTRAFLIDLNEEERDEVIHCIVPAILASSTHSNGIIEVNCHEES